MRSLKSYPQTLMSQGFFHHHSHSTFKLLFLHSLPHDSINLDFSPPICTLLHFPFKMIYYLKHPLLFGPLRSNLVVSSPLWSNSVNSVHFRPILFYSVLLVQYGHFSPIWSNSIKFNPLPSTLSTLVICGPR